MKLLLIALSLLFQQAAPQPGCDKDIWQYVYKPQRLQVLQECATVSGTLVLRRKEKDGDWHIQLKLDSQYDPAVYLNQRNTEAQGGNLVIEPICQGETVQADAIDACAGYKAAGKPIFELPPNGTHVIVTGVLVQDNEWRHGWREIHAVSSLVIK